MWNPSQRGVVLAITVGIFLYLTVRLSFQHTRIPDPQPIDGSRAAELATRFDPNTATQAELAAIPTIGDKLAAAILSYRDQYTLSHPGKFTFTRLEDLRRVRGVGPAKMETLGEYLTFPENK